ncbi:hypothetical protein PHISP_06232 [Aspergillus sp. HF37]|nr:hypothetical protein PHISP_06232 [Aspergillus sp. HF37]
MTSREDSVLAAREPALDDENDWEEFSLSEARVLVPGKSRYAHLLSASPDNPVQVTGLLDEVEEEQESLVLDEDYINKRIVIENVTHYAYGQHNDGEIGVWVAGSAGWFALSPAKGYRPMFNEAVEAIDLLYFLADRHHQRRRRRKKNWIPSVEYLLEEYANHTHGVCEDAEDSAEVLYKHRGFLLLRMMKGGEDVDWTNTTLFAHLCEKFPDDYEQVKAQVMPPSEAEEKPQEEASSDENEMAEPNSDGKDVNDGKTSHSDPDTISKSQADSIYQVILDLKEAGHLAKRQLNLDLVVSSLTSRYEIDTQEYARDLISARAKMILDLMKEAKTPSFDWSRKALYKELKATSRRSNLQHITMTALRRRSEDSESSEESEPRPRRRRVRKSLLRPKLSSVSAKKTGKRTRSATSEQEDQSDEDEEADADADEYATPSKIRGHELVRDPLSTRAKRRTRSILSDSGSAPVQKTPLQETLQSRNTSVSAVEQDASDLDAAQLDDFPPDTWICQAPGCGKAIYKSSTKRGKELVDDHSLAHANDTQARLDIVFSEQRLNINLPVDNLIGRIQELSSQNQELASMANGTSSVA